MEIDRPLKKFSQTSKLFQTSAQRTEFTCGLCYNYFNRTIVTDSGRERVIWRYHLFLNNIMLKPSGTITCDFVLVCRFLFSVFIKASSLLICSASFCSIIILLPQISSMKRLSSIVTKADRYGITVQHSFLMRSELHAFLEITRCMPRALVLREYKHVFL